MPFLKYTHGIKLSKASALRFREAFEWPEHENTLVCANHCKQKFGLQYLMLGSSTLHIKRVVVDTCRRHSGTQHTITWVVQLETFFAKMKGFCMQVRFGYKYICITGKRKKLLPQFTTTNAFKANAYRLEHKMSSFSTMTKAIQILVYITEFNRMLYSVYKSPYGFKSTIMQQAPNC